MGSDVGGTAAAGPEPDECVICMEGRKEWVLYPCLHQALCKQCAKAFRLCDDEEELPFKVCPVCRCALKAPYVLQGDLCGDLRDTLAQRNVFGV